PVPPADRPAALRRREPVRAAGQGTPPASPGAVLPAAGRAGRAGRHLPEMPGQGTVTPLPLGPGPRRRPGALPGDLVAPRREPHPGPAGAAEVVPPPGGGCSAGRVVGAGRAGCLVGRAGGAARGETQGTAAVSSGAGRAADGGDDGAGLRRRQAVV